MHVVISGAGAVSCAGNLEEIVAAAALGRSHLTVPARPDEDCCLGPVADAALRWPTTPAWTDRKKYVGRAAQLGLTAAMQALPLPFPEPSRYGVIAAVDGDESGWRGLVPIVTPRADGRGTLRRVFDELEDFHPLRAIPSLVGQSLAMWAGCEGGSVAVLRTVAGGLSALSLAHRLVEGGELDGALVVGVNPAHSPGGLAFHRTFEEPCVDPRPGHGPYDEGRAGTLLGEGAAALVIESAHSARRRGVTPQATLRGCQVFSAVTAAAALSASASACLDTLGSAPDVVWGSGTGSLKGDAVELEVLQRLRRPTTTLGGCVGALGCAASLLGVAVAMAFLREQRLPPIALLQAPVPQVSDLALRGDHAKALPHESLFVLGASPYPPFSAGVAVLTRTA